MQNTHRLLPRDMYLDRLKACQDSGLAKVVTGIHGCGKSSLLALMREHLLASGIAREQILSIDFKSAHTRSLTPADCCSLVQGHVLPGRRLYLFLDEPQYMRGWEEAVRSIGTNPDCDIFIAASEKSGRPLFCGSYPITPATGILEELAIHKNLGVKTVQAEDEIAGVCTAIGAAYAGDLAVTTTSGPGLSLKSEALGLAVMTELPLVVVDVQRAGPSTGIPTKTEQTDLAQVLYGRNGECPMAVVAAHSPAHCFDAAFIASKLALEHMMPVVLLSEGFLGNGSEPWRIPFMKDYPQINPPYATQSDIPFKPFVRDDRTFVRKWAFPGQKGFEHRVGGLEKSPQGVLSSDPANHELMVRNRAEKVARIADVIPELEVDGPDSGKLLVVGWGGTYGHILSAVHEVRKSGKSVSQVHFDYINPLPKNTGEILSRFEKILVCELNSGQFADWLRARFPGNDYVQCNKVQGQPFLVQEITDAIEKVL